MKRERDRKLSQTVMRDRAKNTVDTHSPVPFSFSAEHGADSPTNGRVSGASGCSGTRSGPNNRAALTAKPRIQARVAGLNTGITGES